MSILATFEKQPADVQDFDIDFTTWLASFSPSDTGLSQNVTVESGITLGATALNSGVVKFWVSGGTSGTKYKATIRLTTTGGRTKEVDVYIKVKDY